MNLHQYAQGAKDFPNQRLVELDWLRVLAFGILIFYHIGMLYAYQWDFHYKSQYTSEFLNNIMLWSNRWRMSLLFLISGAAVSFMLVKESGWRFAAKRVSFLFLPLIFGMLVIVVPQVYVEANSKGWMDVSNYWQFWYTYLDQNSPEFAEHKTVGTSHLTWNHLWFLPYLLAYSLLIWAIYPVLLSIQLVSLWRWLANKISMLWVISIPVLALYFLIALEEQHPVTHNFVADWFNHARSFLFFVIGFVLVRVPRIWNQLSSLRWYFLVVAILDYSYILFAFNGGSLGDSSLAEIINRLLWMANGWFWILTLIAWAQFWFKTTPPVIRYLNSGVYCYYILHQTLIIIVAYYLTPNNLGPVVEPLFVVVLVITGCLMMFEFAKRIPFIAPLLGIQLKKSNNSD
jgi:glucans biosynthesis protein C